MRDYAVSARGKAAAQRFPLRVFVSRNRNRTSRDELRLLP